MVTSLTALILNVRREERQAPVVQKIQPPEDQANEVDGYPSRP